MSEYIIPKGEHDWEGQLPHQLKDYYQEEEIFEKVLYETVKETINVKNPHKKFKITESSLFNINQMASSPVTLQFIQFLIRASEVKTILEIGAFIGLSTMYFAEALPEDGHITTIEKFKDFADIAVKNFKQNNFGSKITLINDDALKVLQEKTIKTKFDMIFIDGNKEHYNDYLEIAVDMTTEKGIIIVDNATFKSDAINKIPQTEKGLGTKRCLEKIKNLSGWEKCFVPFNDGQVLLRKIGS